MDTIPSVGTQVVLLSPLERDPDTELRHRWDVVTVVDSEPVWGHRPVWNPALVRVIETIDGKRYLARETTTYQGGSYILIGIYEPNSKLHWAVPVDPKRVRALELLAQHGLTESDAFTQRPSESTVTRSPDLQESVS